MTDFLLERGAALEQPNNRRETAIRLASKLPSPAILERLIEKGANVNASAANGETALICAASTGQLENVKVLLAAGVDANATAVNPDQPGSAPFDAIAVARERNHPEITALLLQAKEAPAKAKR